MTTPPRQERERRCPTDAVPGGQLGIGVDIVEFQMDVRRQCSQFPPELTGGSIVAPVPARED
jgi:hypothetical protein